MVRVSVEPDASVTDSVAVAGVPFAEDVPPVIKFAPLNEALPPVVAFVPYPLKYSCW